MAPRVQFIFFERPMVVVPIRPREQVSFPFRGWSAVLLGVWREFCCDDGRYATWNAVGGGFSKVAFQKRVYWHFRRWTRG